jgi:ubiquitin-like protein UBact
LPLATSSGKLACCAPKRYGDGASEASTLSRSLPFQYFPLNFFMPERIQKPVDPIPWGPKQGDGGGPRSPDVSRPDTKDLLKKMRKVDPNQSKRYRQRTGQ